jgi:mRNA interferase MazF
MSTLSRGQIYWVNGNPARGSEQSGIRPALIIQNDTGNRLSPNVIVASVTTAPNKPYPFLVLLTAKESGMKENSAVNLGSIMTVGKERLGDKCGQLNLEKMVEVDNAICVSLGIVITKLTA